MPIFVRWLLLKAETASGSWDQVREACCSMTAGDKTSALKHFMDVDGSNIDYPNVAERIWALKS